MFSISTGSRSCPSLNVLSALPAGMSNVGVAVDNLMGSEASQVSADDQVASHVAGLTLPNVLWGKIAEFMPHNDVLNFRGVDLKMVTCVDRSIKSLSVNADRISAMLAVLGRSVGFKHINDLTILFDDNRSFCAAIAALARFPHEKLNLKIEQSFTTATLMDATAMACLRDIRPASLSIKGFRLLPSALLHSLSELDFPISLVDQRYWHQDSAALTALSSIPTLFTLQVRTVIFSDDAARGFRDSDCLQDLHISPIECVYGSDAIAISDFAVEHLAAIPTLRTLSIGATREPLGEQAISALSRNKDLQSLTIAPGANALDHTAAERFSENSSLITLAVSVAGGWSHLTRMASLKNLTLSGPTPITLSESRKFARSAQLRTLDLSKAQFEEGVLATMASSAVEDLTLSVAHLNALEIESLLANRSLRSLHCTISGGRFSTIANALALAAHPTLTSLVFWHVGSIRDVFSVMTNVERDAMLQAWGPHRPRGALQTNF